MKEVMSICGQIAFGAATLLMFLFVVLAISIVVVAFARWIAVPVLTLLFA